ncbi:osmotically inducible protein OsmC [Parabacteroides sp. PFB2-12]|uniref:organic hydroperoxide resistance protein n=1 Tax=unclassified Parabacteroides TaxID=2649774 RepID=UPI002473A775|nr:MULTISPECIES: organic hydroperoxide resistance protein [unclassified Parabacteroides]MDH6342231.1 osmotically inducible protein OsmC [Parabacteroides sp. PM6-13]MDH6391085.1 osmotically inducible protein OsmC [Parabacteroides sp. PFB2-12]
MKALYTAVATNTGGRAGRVTSSDGVINLDLRPPKEMGGPGGDYTNPEQLFAAGYSACYSGAYMKMALDRGVRIRPEVTLKVTLNEVSDGFKLSAVIVVKTTGISPEQAKELAEAAHAFCPYSRATRGNIEVELQTVTE